MVSSAFAAAIALDLDTEEEAVQVSIADVVTYDIAEMTIPLKNGEDGKAHYALVSVTLSMNSKDEDYEAYSDLTSRESLIKGEINSVIAQYTMEQAMDNGALIEEQILERIQTLFNSKFIYDVTIIPLYQ